MPSQSVLEQKKAIVAELSERLKSSITGVVVSYEGINTEDDTKLRKELRENDVKYTVVKNTLLSRACEEAGLEDIKPVLEGTTAIATSDSEYAAAARILCNYAKDHDNFKVKMAKIDLTKYGITGTTEIVHNPSYEDYSRKRQNRNSKVMKKVRKLSLVQLTL